MSKENLNLVQQFRSAIWNIPSEQWSTGWLSEDVTYEILVAQANPVHCSFRGRRAVERYISVTLHNYEILEPAETTLISEGNRVIAHGSEIARLHLGNQVVRAEWIAIYEVELGMIKKITMSIHRWTVLSSNPLVGVEAAPHRADERVRILRTEAII